MEICCLFCKGALYLTGLLLNPENLYLLFACHLPDVVLRIPFWQGVTMADGESSASGAATPNYDPRKEVNDVILMDEGKEELRALLLFRKVCLTYRLLSSIIILL
jgi:hypothetical protein